MQPEFFHQLRKAISHERLDSYKARSNADNELLLAAHYSKNIMLSESLYPVLQAIEIALRNSIHDTITEACGSEEWFNARYNILLSHELESIDKAKINLQRGNKDANPGRIMAELNFGFWTSLFDLRYEQRLWPLYLKAVFPFIPKKIRTRKTISIRMNRIRRLRNRVFHHEPIWYWQDLRQQHNEIVEAIGWINPAMMDFIKALNRFDEVATSHIDFYKQKLSSLKL